MQGLIIKIESKNDPPPPAKIHTILIHFLNGVMLRDTLLPKHVTYAAVHDRRSGSRVQDLVHVTSLMDLLNVALAAFYRKAPCSL